MNDYRILLVEDIDTLRQQIVTSLELEDFQVDDVSNLADAMRLIEEKAFHIALVDLMLDLEMHPATLEGLSVLKRLQSLGEGTLSIVISGQPNTGKAADTITEYGATKYIPKKEILEEGLDFLIEQVTTLASQVELNKYGNASNIATIFAGAYDGRDANPAAWADPFLRDLHPKEGFNGFSRFLKRFCDPLVPLMPKKDVDKPLKYDPDNQLGTGQFWSKSLGIPVELVICSTEKADTIVNNASKPLWQETPVLEPYARNNLTGYIFQLPHEFERSQFVGKL